MKIRLECSVMEQVREEAIMVTTMVVPVMSVMSVMAVVSMVSMVVTVVAVVAMVVVCLNDYWSGGRLVDGNRHWHLLDDWLGLVIHRLWLVLDWLLGIVLLRRHRLRIAGILLVWLHFY